MNHSLLWRLIFKHMDILRIVVLSLSSNILEMAKKMEYEEKFPSLPPTKKIAQSTSSPLV
jgi:hypothetical protein